LISASESIVFLIGLGGLIFIQLNRLQLKRLPASGVLITAYYLLLGGWLLTIIEGFIWRDAVNILEHLCYASSAVMIASWCWRVFRKKETP
jgi:hypothetical protein